MSLKNTTTLTEKQQYWLDHIQQAKTQKQSLSDYARQHTLNLKALYNYQWLFRKKGVLGHTSQSSNFVKVTGKITPTPILTMTLLFPNGIRMEIGGKESDLSTLLNQVYSL